MTPPLLPISTDFVATLDKAGVGFVAALAFGKDDGVVVFGYVKIEEVSCGEVAMAGRAAVQVGLVVVSLVGGLGCECERFVRREEAAH